MYNVLYYLIHSTSMVSNMTLSNTISLALAPYAATPPLAAAQRRSRRTCCRKRTGCSKTNMLLRRAYILYIIYNILYIIYYRIYRYKCKYINQ